MTDTYVDLENRVTFLKRKLELLSLNIQNPNNFSTKESYLIECTRVLKDFYSNLNSSSIQYSEARRDGSVTPSRNLTPESKIDYDYNLFWYGLLTDFKLLFAEMENLESLSISNFNFAVTESNRLISRMKSVSSKVGDYALYNEINLSDVFLARDSFSNLNKIDVQSKFLNEKECNVNQEEGIITLPINQTNSKTVLPTITPEIGKLSNGTAGNNHDIVRVTGVSSSDISVILDNDPDTWFEYERVVNKSNEDEPPLILDIGINLGNEQIVNHLIINPNNFGTTTVLHIDKIETSLDGEKYLSIKDDIPIADYKIEDEENVFVLAPSTSKYSGQGIFTFTPRKIRYIRIVLRQSEPYVIDTTKGSKLRYAIGIRDITIKALRFENKGELISKRLEIGNNNVIRKIMLETNQNPIVDSELTKISYLISHNDGISWNEIQPKHIDTSGTEAKEILNFNNADVDSIKTETEVESVRLKIKLEREDENFDEKKTALNEKTDVKSELHPIPTVSPFSIKLQENPIDGKVVLIDPLFGSRGIKESGYLIRYGIDQNQDFFFNLPFVNFNVPLTKKDKAGAGKQAVPEDAANYLFVYVGGERWSQTSISNLSDPSLNDQALFNFNPVDGELEFNSQATGADTLEDNSPIMLHFSPERLFLGEKYNEHKASLDFETSNSKIDFKITSFGKETAVSDESINENATVHKMAYDNISEGSVTVTGWNEVSFMNGRNEFTSSLNTNIFSVDTTNGIIYFGNVTLSAGIKCNYNYTPKTVLTNEDWDWLGEGGLKKEIAIKESGWNPIEEIETISLNTGKKFGLLNFNVVRNTFVPPPLVSPFTESNYPYKKEITFVDGETEFQSIIDTGEYSVDYEKGEVWLNTSNVETSQVFEYYYTDYQAEYRTARKVDPNHYTVNVASKEIFISDGEIFKNIETPRTVSSGRSIYYLVNYEYVSKLKTGIEELKNYFSPVVKDYLIKMIKRGAVL